MGRVGKDLRKGELTKVTAFVTRVTALLCVARGTTEA